MITLHSSLISFIPDESLKKLKIRKLIKYLFLDTSFFIFTYTHIDIYTQKYIHIANIYYIHVYICITYVLYIRSNPTVSNSQGIRQKVRDSGILPVGSLI